MTITVIANIHQHSIRDIMSVEMVIWQFFVSLIDFYKKINSPKMIEKIDIKYGSRRSSKSNGILYDNNIQSN
jgi:hypothetical protein